MNDTDAYEKNKDYLFVWQNGLYRKMSIGNVMYLEADGNYCRVVSADGKNLLLTVTMLKAGEAFRSASFIRISRSCIVNIRYVDAVRGNALYIGKRIFSISRSHRQEFGEKFFFLNSSQKTEQPE